jgi:hypothetical protein
VTITLVHRSETVTQLRWGRVFFVVGQGGTEGFESSMQNLRQLAESSGPVALVVVAQAGLTKMTPEERRAMQVGTASIEHLLACQVTLVRGTGFFASAMLAAAASIMTFLKPRYPRIISRDERESAVWLAARLRELGEQVRDAELIAVFGDVLRQTTSDRGDPGFAA